MLKVPAVGNIHPKTLKSIFHQAPLSNLIVRRYRPAYPLSIRYVPDLKISSYPNGKQQKPPNHAS